MNIIRYGDADLIDEDFTTDLDIGRESRQQIFDTMENWFRLREQEVKVWNTMSVVLKTLPDDHFASNVWRVQARKAPRSDQFCTLTVVICPNTSEPYPRMTIGYDQFWIYHGDRSAPIAMSPRRMLDKDGNLREEIQEYLALCRLSNL